MRDLPNITESEWDIMSTLWGEHPLTAADIVNRVQAEKNLAPTTVKTLLRRLIAKNAVGFTVDENNKKLYHYYPLVEEKDCVVRQSEHFLSLYFKDNFKKMFTTFVANSDLTDEEIDSLKGILEQKKGEEET